jgi:hypothetical protein
VTEKPFHLEDLTPGKYVIQDFFTLDSGLDPEGESTISFFGLKVRLNGFAHVFTAKKFTIWASMKVTGAAYGGDPNDTDAIWFDRMFLVRKE